MNSRRVLLYGGSLLLCGLAAGLEQFPDLQVQVAATWPEVSGLLSEHIPDVFVFDLSDACNGHMMQTLVSNPRMLMIGLDAEQNRAVLVSGQEAQSLTLNRITEIIGGPR